MNNNIKNNISYILDVSIKNKGKFYAGVFFSLLSAIVSLLIPLILGSVLDILTKTEGKIECCGTHKYLLEHSTTYRKLILTL